MSANSAGEVRVGATDSVLEVEVGRLRVDVPRSVGYFGGLALAVQAGLLAPSLAVFIAAVPAFKALTNTALPLPIRSVGEVLEGAAKPVGSDAEGVVELEDQKHDTEPRTYRLPSGTGA